MSFSRIKSLTSSGCRSYDIPETNVMVSPLENAILKKKDETHDSLIEQNAYFVFVLPLERIKNISTILAAVPTSNFPSTFLFFSKFSCYMLISTPFLTTNLSRPFSRLSYPYASLWLSGLSSGQSESESLNIFIGDSSSSVLSQNKLLSIFYKPQKYFEVKLDDCIRFSRNISKDTVVMKDIKQEKVDISVECGCESPLCRLSSFLRQPYHNFPSMCVSYLHIYWNEFKSFPIFPLQSFSNLSLLSSLVTSSSHLSISSISREFLAKCDDSFFGAYGNDDIKFISSLFKMDVSALSAYIDEERSIESNISKLSKGIEEEEHCKLPHPRGLKEEDECSDCVDNGVVFSQFIGKESCLLQLAMHVRVEKHGSFDDTVQTVISDDEIDRSNEIDRNTLQLTPSFIALCSQVEKHGSFDDTVQTVISDDEIDRSNEIDRNTLQLTPSFIALSPKKKDDLFGVEKNTGPFQPSRPSSLPLFSVDIGSSRKEMIPVWPPSIGEIVEPIVDTAVCVMPISDEFQHVNEGVRAKLCSEEHDVHGDNAMSGGDEAKDKVEGDDVIEEEDHNAQTTSPTQTQDNKDDEEEGHVLKSRHKPSEVLEPFNFSSISQMNASYLHMLSEIRGVSVDELIESIDPSVFSLVYELFNVLSMGTMG
ncbi:hypothetical protein ADUPG1_000695 [Aduncisulcus paluster]|uniref:Uncharacterized protein n=1 Tax=Aduncisulcus paluster TaxID=2918883 RepID=A0ABQ5K9B5_9EUKA|nr:hypothetical protein ADUPG1_000695 [Aduncisulcus paluster]